MHVTTHLADQAPTVLAAGTGFIDWAGGKVDALGALFRGASIVFGILFVIIRAVQTRGALSAILIAGVAAAIFVWIVWNVSALKDRVGNEVNAAPSSLTQLHTGPSDSLASFLHPVTA